MAINNDYQWLIEWLPSGYVKIAIEHGDLYSSWNPSHILSLWFTLWLFNIAMENPPIFKFGKPSISMGHHFPWQTVSHNQRIIQNLSGKHQPFLYWSTIPLKKPPRRAQGVHFCWRMLTQALMPRQPEEKSSWGNPTFFIPKLIINHQ